MENNRPSVLKRNSEFLSIKKNGKRAWPTKWLLLNFVPSEEMKFGMTISRKVGSSVVRNRLKRWIREYVRDLAKAGSQLNASINFIFKPIDQGFYKGLQHEEFRKAMDQGLEIVRKSL